jgi:DNA-binding CsgD family transcriptional regulator
VVEVLMKTRARNDCPLTNSEYRVLKLVAKGYAPKEIATYLGCQHTTIRTHLANSYKKLDVTNGAQAVVVALEKGWFQYDPPLHFNPFLNAFSEALDDWLGSGMDCDNSRERMKTAVAGLKMRAQYARE